MTTPTQIISGAITQLEQNGHTKGQYLNKQGELCLTGAMMVAAKLVYVDRKRCQLADMDAGLDTESSRYICYRTACQIVARAIQVRKHLTPASYRGSSGESIVVRYNDTECDGGEDAILLLKEALALSEEEGIA